MYTNKKCRLIQVFHVPTIVPNSDKYKCDSGLVFGGKITSLIQAVIKYFSYFERGTEAKILLQEFVFHDGSYPLLKCVSPQKTSIIFWKSHIFQKNLNKITKKFTILVKLTARFIFDLGLLRAALERSKVL